MSPLFLSESLARRSQQYDLGVIPVHREVAQLGRWVPANTPCRPYNGTPDAGLGRVRIYNTASSHCNRRIGSKEVD